MRKLAFLLLAGLAACGGPEAGPLDLRIERSGSALDARLDTVTVRLFAGDQSCDIIELSGPRVRGLYETSVSPDGSGGAAELSIGTILPDFYTVVVWGVDVDQGVVQFGCTEDPVEIVEGREALITVELRDRFSR